MAGGLDRAGTAAEAVGSTASALPIARVRARPIRRTRPAQGTSVFVVAPLFATVYVAAVSLLNFGPYMFDWPE